MTEADPLCGLWTVSESDSGNGELREVFRKRQPWSSKALEADLWCHGQRLLVGKAMSRYYDYPSER